MVTTRKEGKVDECWRLLRTGDDPHIDAEPTSVRCHHAEHDGPPQESRSSLQLGVVAHHSYPATSKLAQADATAARQAGAVNLGIPAYRDIAAATLITGGPPWTTHGR